jgi:D-3-phosphoglycerate dehydrogenase
MLGLLDQFEMVFKEYGMQVTAPDVIQTLSEAELKRIVPKHDGWIIGDDPATRDVFLAGQIGRLKAAVKWGIGVDNVDFAACKELGIPIANTPNMFGGEVADVAVGYVIALARETFQIDRGVREGGWPKPCGISLEGKTVALIGYGDIGKSIARRLLPMGMKILAYDPTAEVIEAENIKKEVWPIRISEADFIVISCALTPSSKKLLNENIFKKVKRGVRIVNVGRGPIIDEFALEQALGLGIVYSAALDVFEVEPLPDLSYLRTHPRCVLGSHNSSNTLDAVVRTSKLAIEKLAGFLNDSR